MITIFEFGLISQDIYDGIRPFKDIKISALIANKEISGIFRLRDHKLDTTQSNGFYAALYIKFQYGKPQSAVIAFRGTVLSEPMNVIEDIYSWYSSAIGSGWHDHMPGYYSDAVNFVCNVKQYLRNNFPSINPLSHLSYTGHSLGGALAQLLSLIDHPAPCCVFNSPVCRHIVPKDCLENWSLVTNVNAHYGVINKIGGVPVGKLQVINNPYLETEAKALSQYFNRKEYTEGKLLSQLSETKPLSSSSGLIEKIVFDVEGTKLQLEAIASATEGLTELPEAQLEIVHCEDNQQYTQLIKLFSNLSSKQVCNANESEKMLFSIPKVIMAQHSISNMVSALQQQAILAGAA